MFPEGRILDFLIVGVIALIVVGPKDLPILMRRAGRFLAHMRGMAAEFRASFDELARQSELDELRREVEALRSGQPIKEAVGLAPEGDVQQVFTEIHAGLRAGEAHLHPVMNYAAGGGPSEDAKPEGAPEPTSPAPSSTASGPA
jgi:sec-independent protein translocase protein TatB